MSRSPSLAEVLRAVLETRIGEIHVSLPGRVESYDASQQKANIQPMVKKILVGNNGEELMSLPVINDVPIIFPRTSNFFISMPVEKGDFVLLIFNERSIEKWMDSNGSEVNPTDLRMHHLSDAVAMPGFYPFGKSLKDASTTEIVIGKDNGGMQVHVKGSQVELTRSGFAQKSAAVAEPLQVLYTTAQTLYGAHVHPTALGPSGPPAAPLPSWDATINSSQLKIPSN